MLNKKSFYSSKLIVTLIGQVSQQLISAIFDHYLKLSNKEGTIIGEQNRVQMENLLSDVEKVSLTIVTASSFVLYLKLLGRGLEGIELLL